MHIKNTGNHDMPHRKKITARHKLLSGILATSIIFGATAPIGKTQVAHADDAAQVASADPRATKTIYTKWSGGGTTLSGSGTKASPYNQFQQALDAAESGDTIVVVDKGFQNTVESDGSGLAPLVIDKAITIRGEGSATSDAMAELQFRPAGIVLGADVTFQNIKLNMVNRYHSYIVANGHSLALDNVGHDSGYRNPSIVGGSLYQNSTAEGASAAVVSTALVSGVPSPGSASKITIKGANSEFDNIYAGSINSTFGGSVTIEVDQSVPNGKIGNIYASGAAETIYNMQDWFNLAPVDPPTAKPTEFSVAGKVSVSLHDRATNLIEGAGAQGGTYVTYSTGAASSNSRLELKDVAGLDVTKGLLTPASLTAAASGMDLTVRDGAVLDLSNKNITSVPQIKTYKGGDSTNGGNVANLVLRNDQTMYVSGAVSGTTQLRTPYGTASYSGPALINHDYIVKGTQASGAFVEGEEGGMGEAATFTDSNAFTYVSNPAQPYFQLQKNDDKWTMVSTNEDVTNPQLSGIEFEQKSHTVSSDQFSNVTNFEFKVTGAPAEDGDGMFASDYEFTFNVYKDGVKHDAVPDEGFVSSATVESLNMEIYVTGDTFSDDGTVVGELNISPKNLSQSIAPGLYTIEVCAAYNGVIYSDSFNLIVTEAAGDNASQAADTKTSVSASQTSHKYGELAELTVKVAPISSDESTVTLDSQTASALQKGNLDIYVNGQKLDTRADIDVSESASKNITLSLTTVNGFSVGENTITVMYTPIDADKSTFNPSATTTTLTVDKTEPAVANFDSSSTTSKTYDGSSLAVGGFTVSVPSGTAADNAGLKYDLVYTYEDNGKTVEMTSAPSTVGTHKTKLKIEESDFTSAKEVDGPTISIKQADATMSLNVVSKTDTSAVVGIKVAGASGGIVPSGTAKVEVVSKSGKAADIANGKGSVKVEVATIEAAASVTFTDSSGYYSDSTASTTLTRGYIAMMRLYNPNSGEHLYTHDANEKSVLVSLGWIDEGIGWKASLSGSAVYRLYNPNSGDHHFTKDKNEYDTLARIGWTQEGVGWYSDDSQGEAVYRLFNPNLTVGTHHYTTDKNEYTELGKIGWKQEGIAWYALK
jgi:hypothetical protein